MNKYTAMFHKLLQIPQTESKKNDYNDNNNNITLDDMHIKSNGIDGIINALEDPRFVASTVVWDTTLVNIGTFIRNNNDNNFSTKDIIEKTLEDILNFIKSVSNFYNKHPNAPVFPYIIFYIPDYSCLPDENKRNSTKASLRIQELLTLFEKEQKIKTFGKTVFLDDIEQCKLTISGVDCYFIKCGNKIEFPHKQLVKIVTSIDKLYVQKKHPISFGIDKKYILITHYPIDFHLFFLFPKMVLMESFTGVLKPFSMLGVKIFKIPFVPFNKYTHILFGDAVQIKPLVQRKLKQEFLTIAQENRWKSKTSENILNDIISKGKFSRQLFMSVKL